MAKKKLLFIIDSLTIGGAEKSLVTLLNMLDYEKYEVDLQLFAPGGMLSKYLPEEVNILPQIPLMTFLRRNNREKWKSLHIPYLFRNLRFHFGAKSRKSDTISTVCHYWRCFSGAIPRSSSRYDVAIGYGQGMPTMYTAEKARADRKFAWINACYEPRGEAKRFLEPYYSRLDGIVPVSDGAKRVFENVYPCFSDKMTVIWDIVNPDIIRRMALEKPTKHIDTTKPVIVTMARLDGNEKGLDITMKAAKILRDRGVDFTWNIFGQGPFYWALKKFIADNSLEHHLILHGAVGNPYPYLALATIYVQTSRAEGFGLSLAEARLLDKPIVTTAFKGVENQMHDGKNGVVVPISPEAVADGVERLLTDSALYDSIKAYLLREKKGNPEEINCFYRLIADNPTT